MKLKTVIFSKAEDDGFHDNDDGDDSGVHTSNTCPPMNDSIFVEKEFALLILISIIVPVDLYTFMMLKRALSRWTVLLFGVILVVIAGANVVLLQRLAAMATASPSLLDNRLFSSEISLALYLLPALFAGLGINIISHVLVTHLGDAERQFEQERVRTDNAKAPPH